MIIFASQRKVNDSYVYDIVHACENIESINDTMLNHLTFSCINDIDYVKTTINENGLYAFGLTGDIIFDANFSTQDNRKVNMYLKIRNMLHIAIVIYDRKLKISEILI